MDFDFEKFCVSLFFFDFVFFFIFGGGGIKTGLVVLTQFC